MKIQVGRKTRNLSKSSFISQGGEGAVYVLGDLAYKIYHNPDNLIPLAKIDELSQIKDDAIIKPIEVIMHKDQPVGYTMKYIPDAHPLCKVFTKAFKQRNGLGNSEITKLVEGMRDSVYSVHKHNILIVDCNELNFLISEDFKTVYFIDTDSYQTPSFSATAIMDSIRDRHTSSFNEGSDWFSWGVITFQMFTGIHPYKGRHPDAKSLEERMQKNISVFNKKVTVPKTTLSFTSIPYTFRVWYESLFEKGVRCAPPGPGDPVVAIDTQPQKGPIIQSTENLQVVLERSLQSNIAKIEYSGANSIIWTSDEIIYQSKQEIKAPLDSYLYVNYNGDHLVWLDKGLVTIQNLETGKLEITDILGTALMSREGRIYILNEDKIYELMQPNYTKKTMYTGKMVAQVLPHATYLYPGVILQNFLGNWYASIPYRSGACMQIPMRQLPKGCRIIAARAEDQVLSVTFFYQGFYQRKTFIYDISFKNCDEINEMNVQNLEPNFTILDNNICAYLNDNDELVIFRAECSHTTSKKIVRDSELNHNMKLLSYRTAVKFFQDNQIFSISLKK